MTNVPVLSANGEFKCEFCPKKILHGRPYVFTQVKKGSSIIWARAHQECFEKLTPDDRSKHLHYKTS